MYSLDAIVVCISCIKVKTYKPIPKRKKLLTIHVKKRSNNQYTKEN